MYRVGDKLVAIAIGATDNEEADLFGRSAINRYYYACFLDAREAVLHISPTLKIRHSQLPTNLEGAVADTVRKEIRRLERELAISSTDADSYRVTLNRAVSSLAQTLESAYKLRVTADYEPEKKAIRDKGIVLLDGTTSTKAKDWHREVAKAVGRMMKLWSDLGQK
jgi:hypothetical protein